MERSTDTTTAAAPITVRSADDVTWDADADVVVVGYGGAGACAALQAREDGADVIVVDSFAGGGTTAYSGGVIYAGGTRFQSEAGYDDDADKMHAYLSLEVGDVVREETLRRYCDQSATDIDWLVAHGVRYASDLYEGKTNFPPEGKYLYYSGNEKMPQYAAKTPPIPRGHRAVGPGYGGPHYFAALARAVDGSGVRVRRHEKARRLVVDSTGRVVGVEVRSLPEDRHVEHQRLYAKASPWIPLNRKTAERARLAARKLEEETGRLLLIRARGGVILSTGSFAYNPDLLRRHDPSLAKYYRKLHLLGTLGSDGSGIELGQSVGGAVGRMGYFYLARAFSPPSALLTGIMVNKESRRFINEDSYCGFVGLAIAKQTDAQAWLILPARAFRKAISQALFGGWHLLKFFGVPALINFTLGGTKRGRTLERIAKACGIDPQGLQATAAAHDGAVAANSPDSLGKSDAYRTPLGKGPFYAVNMSISNEYAFTYFMTLGGLTVDEESGAVTRADGSAIDGLYAAGLAAVGLHSNGYISGISLGDGMFAGRRAGRASSRAANRARVAQVA